MTLQKPNIEFNNVLKVLSANYRILLTQEECEVWYAQFKSYPVNVFADAVKNHMDDPMDGRYPPTFSHILNQIQGDPKGQKKEMHARVETLWVKIRMGLKDRSNKSLKKLGEIQGQLALIMVGNWNRLSQLTEGQLLEAKKEFGNAYESLEDKPQKYILEKLPPEYAPKQTEEGSSDDGLPSKT